MTNLLQGITPKHGSFHVLGLLGPAYSGSTIWTRVLGGLQGVMATGEERAIISERRPCYCSNCRRKPCPIYTPGLLQQLRACKPRAHDSPWWQILQAATGARVLLSSDKYPKHYDELGLPDVACVCWKDPREAVASLLKRQRISSPNHGAYQVRKFYEFILSWCQHYKLPILPLSLPRLLLERELYLEALCHQVGLPFDPEAMKLKTVHHVGGNSGACRSDRLSASHTWYSTLSPEHAEFVLQVTRPLLSFLCLDPTIDLDPEPSSETHEA